MDKPEYRSVGKSVRKKDSLQLLLGKPVYTEDIAPDALVVKLLRSPHANAMVKAIDASKAKKVPGVVDVYTWEDVPDQRFSNAGQTYPETSPYDRLIIDRHVRFVGDVVAIVAAENQKAAQTALSRIKVEYDVLEPVLDFRTAKDNPVLVHPEDNWHMLCDLGGDNTRNLVGTTSDAGGDIEAVLADCDVVLERTYHTKAYNQAMMETFRTFTQLDRYGRLHVISSTQIVYHVRRILSHALGIPKSRIRVEKPRIGGGFGAKQTAVSEVYPAFVTMKTGRPALCVFSRKESQTCGSPRHEMEVKVRLGANNDGRIRALGVTTLSNSGAYGEHGWATVGLTGHKSIPLYTGSLEAFKFDANVVYTNMQPSGAYRGFGATQGQFAVESAVNELAAKLGRDPVELREQNMVREGMAMPAYFGEVANACALDRCMQHCSDMFGWKDKFPVRDMGNGKVRAAGVAMSMQGSGISGIDVGSVTVKLNDDGGYMLLIAAADMGTGCDTILAQMVAEHMECPVDAVSVFGADTDASPYDSGSYASSTTYVTGMAVEKACTQLKERLCAIAAAELGCDAAELRFEGGCVRHEATGRTVSLPEIAAKSQCNCRLAPEATAQHSSPVSPPPYMVGMVEIELDRETGVVEVLDYAAVVDCGIPINPALARIQVEGGIVQGIGHTLMEDVTRTPKGAIRESSLFTYRLPTRLDTGRINVEFEHSYEPTGPFGAKSIGEIVINTPGPALAQAIYRATGVWHRELPILPERILLAKPEE
ncbi:xanthine dehydrogenase family protein molybdopterin-binding subunit [Senegalimassilia anaerobia]|uniref:xanthine dehydrogenase family protein molybdopterin-binding subunit n=1 Tax=Senegalimassilia anaerobia TaxID=1473216 RepID=UPI002E79AB3C|nr:molybdopterin cofactor-binding domain-containing protein [Senegalimassilia anaerobia]MEE0225894.1 molybdopterin cofactor-binding domain-containing protein [Senegalimassilia anaerobia]